MILQNDHTGTRVSQVINEREQAEREVAGGILDFYLTRYPEVYVVICNGCKENLILEYLDPTNMNQHHHFNRQVIELSPKYGAHRARLDGVEGYQCKCGNDNRWAYVEWQAVRHGGKSVPPHEEEIIRRHIADIGYTPDVKVKGRDMIIENKFIVRRLK